MPPKNKENAEKRPTLIGRIGTNLKVGIVGLPNVGKSTFFNVLTKSAVPAENFPFCTIDPNESRVAVPDERFDYLCEFYKPERKIPAFLNVVDVAGLTKGASDGIGLGNAFLSHINACDAVFEMCRAFEDEDVTHVEGDVNPVRDIGIIYEELRLKDLQHVNALVEKAAKVVERSNDKAKTFEFQTLLNVRKLLADEKRHVRFGSWSDKEVEALNKHLFLTAKPIVYLANISEEDYIKKKNKWLGKIKAYIDENDPGSTLVPFSGALEAKLVDMDVEERTKYLESVNSSSALPKIIKCGYKALQLEYFFTTGKDEVKAWTIQKGTKAAQAAGRIHTDFEKGFIMAEVMKFDELKSEGSEAAVKAAGKYRQQGRNYTVEDGDIILFKFNAGAGLQGKKK
ncbi:GTP binding protein CG1354 [Trichuris trichiura]|uniref:Obg-like ATPase 1 n=1 Tax=Trichuris trichiura TaxID=36087 RepID=A0A077Z0C0_TRITR|nr:GTP binding protein CG1354 [Trichuris trichiura]